MSAALVECEGLVHIYRRRDLEVVALQGLDLSVSRREVVAIVGRSGSGKTTLMNILAGLDRPSAGAATVAGHDLTRMDEAELDRYRQDVIGYVLQHSQANLATDLDALENVILPTRDGPPAERAESARSLLAAMNIEHLATSRPGELSGGEAQRLAIAIAMANRPALLLADEPTAELDTATARGILRDLRDLLSESESAAVMVTHDPKVQLYADRVIQIRDGRTSTETTWREERGRVVADELLILDKVGRLQLPKAFVEGAQLKGRVRAHLEAGEIRLTRADAEEERR